MLNSKVPASFLEYGGQYWKVTLFSCLTGLIATSTNDGLQQNESESMDIKTIKVTKYILPSTIMTILKYKQKGKIKNDVVSIHSNSNQTFIYNVKVLLT